MGFRCLRGLLLARRGPQLVQGAQLVQVLCFGTSVQANAPIEVIEPLALNDPLELVDELRMWPAQSTAELEATQRSIDHWPAKLKI